MHDAAHARNALARMSQSPFGQKAKKKIMAACKKFGIEVAGQNNQESGPNEELTAMVGALVAHGCTIHMMSTPQMGTNSQESADLGYRETMSKVQALLNTMDTGDKLHFLQEVYDDQVIYEVATRGTGQSSYYTQEYEVDDNGDVNLVGVPTKVIRRVSFVTANSETNSDGGINTMAETTVKKPCCPGKVELLIQSELSPFEEIDREWLSGLEEGQIDRLVQTDVALSEATKKAEEKPPQVNREQAISVLKEDLSDREKFVTLLPEALQEEVRSGLNLHRERRQKMIQALVEAFPKKFTEDKLKNRTTEALEELIGMIPEKPADFSANGAGSESINANMGMAADDILLPIGVEIK